MFADELAVSDLDLSAYRHNGRAAFDLHAFEAVVIVIDVLSLGRDDAPILGIVDDQVRVAADGNRSLPRKQPEDLRRPRTRRIDKAMKIQSAALHSVRVQQVDAIFDPGNAVGDLREGVFAQAASGSVSNGQWSVPTVSIRPNCNAFQRAF